MVCFLLLFINTMTKNNLGKRGLICFTCSKHSLSLREARAEGSSGQEVEVRNWSRGSGGILSTYCFSFHGLPTSHLIQPRTTYPGVVSTTVKRDLPRQMVIKKTSHRLAIGQCGGGNFSIAVPSSQINTTCVELTKINSIQKSHASLASLDHMLWLGSDMVS